MTGKQIVFCVLVFSAVILAAFFVSKESVGSEDMLTARLEETVKKNWGDAVDLESAHKIEKDFTCDGKADVVMGRVSGDHYDLLVMTEDGGSFYSENVSIPFDGASNQIGLCYQAGRDKDPIVSVDAWDKEEANAVFGQDICIHPIMIADENCDPLYYFWAPKNKDSKLAPYRE